MNLYKEALIYYDMGWGVYPSHTIASSGLCSCGTVICPCPGKHPVGRWIDYQTRLPTVFEIELWFSSLDCNIGTVTGQISHLAVVDIDGDKGMDSLRKLDLEDTLTALTGSGGFHMFYSLDGPAPTRTGILPGIDIRADGGYVVLAPSIHKSGHNYEWLKPTKMAPFNNDLFEAIAPRNTKPIDWHSELLRGVGEGERSNTAAKLAGRYMNLNLTDEEVWILLSVWNERNSPPLLDYELKRTLVWARNKNANTEPKTITTMSEIRALLKE